MTFWALLLFAAACQSSDDKPAITIESKKAGPPQPFHFLSRLEVVPGLTFDVVSWGRGAPAGGGAYMILRSDSARVKYRSISGDLDGVIAEAWNMDMDADGNPEIYIRSRSEGENGTVLHLYVYEFGNSGDAQQLRFPDLTAATKKRYRGQDTLYIHEGRIRRGFPLFNEADSTGKSPVEKKLVEYDLRGNTFTVKEIADSPAK